MTRFDWNEGDVVIVHKPTFDERVAKLERFTVYGPGYNRNVTGNIADARRFHAAGSVEYAEVFLRKAEAQAHFADTGEWISPHTGQAVLPFA